MPRPIATEVDTRRLWRALACAALVCALIFAARAGAAGDAGSLQRQVESAQSQAGAIAAELQAKQSELAAAQTQAAAASAHEERLSGLLASGQAHAVALGVQVSRSLRRLAMERGHLRRARAALSRRVVAIYESGSPSTASVILASSDFNELATRTAYLDQIESSDAGLAQRVEQVRDSVHRKLERVAALKERADAYDARLTAARTQISSVRQSAEQSAAQLQSIAAARAASLSTLKAKIGHWVGEIRAARAAAAERASEAEAQEEVGRWLGGPFSIPTYIVMCESGGNYGAVNPSSGAGGAYQILPSTWQLYGGKGSPEDAPKAEQDSIAAQIWADSGPSAWVCGG